MSNKEKRPVEDHHIANLDRHAQKIVEKLQANEWKILSTPDVEVYEMSELFQDQAELEKILSWLTNIKAGARPPRILNPGQGPNGMKLVN